MAIVEKHFKVAGVPHYIDDFYDELSYPNDSYDSTASELIEYFGEYERVFQYDFHNANTELRPEPDNQYDPNAVAIFVSGHKIGYVKKGSCSQVKNLISSPDFKKAWVFINGGKYKSAHTDENGRAHVVKGECEYFADLYIKIDDGKPVAQLSNNGSSRSHPGTAKVNCTPTPASEKAASNMMIGFGIFCIVLGLLTLFSDLRMALFVYVGGCLIFFGLKIRKSIH